MVFVSLVVSATLLSRCMVGDADGAALLEGLAAGGLGDVGGGRGRMGSLTGTLNALGEKIGGYMRQRLLGQVWRSGRPGEPDSSAGGAKSQVLNWLGLVGFRTINAHCPPASLLLRYRASRFSTREPVFHLLGSFTPAKVSSPQ